MKEGIILWTIFFKNSFMRDLEFKTDFILQAIGNLFKFLLVLIFFRVIFLHTPAIGDWNMYEIWVLSAINQVVMYIYSAFFSINLAKFPEYVREGNLDQYLVKPIDIQFLISTRFVDTKPLFLIIFPIILLFYSLANLNLSFSLYTGFLFLFLLICGITIRFGIGFFIMTLSFWMTRVEAVYALQDELFKYSSYPASIFKYPIKFVFTYIFPVILIANFPAEIILKRPSFYLFMVTFLFTIVIFFLARKFFFLAIRNYSSSSS